MNAAQNAGQTRKLPVRLGSYLLVYRIAAGGMGEVYLAFQKSALSKRLVAVKVQGRTSDLEDEVMRQMFLSEARASANLQHPNVIHVYEVDEVDGIPYIAMEYIEGSSAGAIRRAMKPHGGKVPPHVTAAILLDTARALAYAHAEGLIHRDVSPPNILISDAGQVKLIDFGVAKAESEQHTVLGLVKGKYAYMAPEYLQAQQATPACDIFSLGVVMNELLTGKRVYSGESAGVVISSVLQKDVPAVQDLAPEVPAKLAELVNACCARDPALRPTAADIVTRIEGMLAEITPPGAPPLTKWINDLMSASVAARRKLRQDALALDLNALEAAAPSFSGIDVTSDEFGPRSGANAIEGSVSGQMRIGSLDRSNTSMGGGSGALMSTAEQQGGRNRGVVFGLIAVAASVLVAAVIFLRKGNDPPPVVAAPTPPPTAAPAQPSSTKSPEQEEASKHRQNGMKAMAGHQYESAIKEFETAIKLGATDADIGQLLALAMTLKTQEAKKPPEAKADTPAPATPARAAPVWRAPTPTRSNNAKEPAAAEKPAEVEEKGVLFVTSTPPGLSAEVDGRPAGATPLQLSLPPGSHSVRILKDGQVVHSANPHVTANGIVSVYGEYKAPAAAPPPPAEPPPAVAAAAPVNNAPPAPAPAPATVARDYGELLVQSPNVLGRVIVGGVDRGPAPVVVRNVPVGSTTVEIRVGSTVRRSRVVDVAKDQRKTVFFE